MRDDPFDDFPPPPPDRSWPRPNVRWSVWEHPLEFRNPPNRTRDRRASNWSRVLQAEVVHPAQRKPRRLQPAGSKLRLCRRRRR